MLTFKKGHTKNAQGHRHITRSRDLELALLHRIRPKNVSDSQFSIVLPLENDGKFWNREKKKKKRKRSDCSDEGIQAKRSALLLLQAVCRSGTSNHEHYKIMCSTGETDSDIE